MNLLGQLNDLYGALMRFKVAGKTRVLFESNCIKRLGFKFPAFYAQAFASDIQAYAVTPLELLTKTSCEPVISEFVMRPRLSEAIDYHVAMAMELMPEALDRANAEQAACYRYWEGQIERFRMHAEIVIERFQPEGIVCFQGYYLEAAVLRELAAEREIECLAWEFSFLKGHLVWDNLTGITIGSPLPSEFYRQFRGRKSRETIMSNTSELLAGLKAHKSLEHQSPEGRDECTLLGDRPVLLFLGQVYTDSSIVFGRDGFKDPVELMEALEATCLEFNYQLVIKLHPKENGGHNPLGMPYRQLTKRKLEESTALSHLLESGRIICDASNELDTYDLINRSSVVVTLNSQAGLEAAVMDRPVVVCGQAFYANNGFTEHALSRESLSDAVRLAVDTWSPGRHFCACEFLDIFLNHYSVPMKRKSILQACRKMKGGRE